MRRTKPITLDICCAVLQRSDLFGLYISPMAPLFPPEFATASSISGIQIARTTTVISPSAYHHRRKCRLNMLIHCSLPTASTFSSVNSSASVGVVRGRWRSFSSHLAQRRAIARLREMRGTLTSTLIEWQGYTSGVNGRLRK